MTGDFKEKEIGDLDIAAKIQQIENAVSTLSSNMESLYRMLGDTLQVIRNTQSIYLGDHRALTRLQSGHMIFVDTRSVDIGTHLLMRGLWEPNYVKAFLKLLNPGDVVIDVGANHGVYSILAAQSVGGKGKIFAFEPNPVFADLIRASKSVNGFDRIITLIQSGLSDREYEIELVVDKNWSGGGHIASDHDNPDIDSNRYKINCIPLDDLPDLADISVNAIKMDIEGAEGLALHGMRRLIDRSPDVKVMMEFCPHMLDKYEMGSKQVIEFFQNRGFHCWNIDANGSLARSEWLSLLDNSSEIRNIIVARHLPSERSQQSRMQWA